MHENARLTPKGREVLIRRVEAGQPVAEVAQAPPAPYRPLDRPDPGPFGNGLLLSFRVGDFDAGLARARALVPALEEEPARNPDTDTPEFALHDLALRDPDGDYVMVGALDAA